MNHDLRSSRLKRINTSDSAGRLVSASNPDPDIDHPLFDHSRPVWNPENIHVLYYLVGEGWVLARSTTRK